MCICFNFRRYLALCVGETRVRFDLQVPLKLLVKKNIGKKSGKISVSPTKLRFLSQVRSGSFLSFFLQVISDCLFCLFSCCHSISALSMWWCWTSHILSHYGTWLLQASLCYLTTSIRGSWSIHTVFSYATFVIFLTNEDIFFPFNDRLAWNFSVGQLSSKVLKSSQLVGCHVFTEIENSAWLHICNIFFVVGYMPGWSGPQPAAVWRCESARDETRFFVSECEDAFSRAAWGIVYQSALTARIFQKEHP